MVIIIGSHYLLVEGGTIELAKVVKNIKDKKYPDCIVVDTINIDTKEVQTGRNIFIQNLLSLNEATLSKHPNKRTEIFNLIGSF